MRVETGVETTNRLLNSGRGTAPRKAGRMQSEGQIRRRLRVLEKEMAAQFEVAMEHGFPVFCWDRNCVEREVLTRVLGLKWEPFCAADVMAGW